MNNINNEYNININNGYQINKCNKCCAWFQMIIALLGILFNFLLIASNINQCNNITDTNIEMCIENVYVCMFIVTFNMTIQPLVFFHGYNTLRLNVCSSKRFKYIEDKIEQITFTEYIY